MKTDKMELYSIEQLSDDLFKLKVISALTPHEREITITKETLQALARWSCRTLRWRLIEEEE